jgi:hypothetical protein
MIQPSGFEIDLLIATLLFDVVLHSFFCSQFTHDPCLLVHVCAHPLSGVPSTTPSWFGFGFILHISLLFLPLSLVFP